MDSSAAAHVETRLFVIIGVGLLAVAALAGGIGFMFGQSHAYRAPWEAVRGGAPLRLYCYKDKGSVEVRTDGLGISGDRGDGIKLIIRPVFDPSRGMSDPSYQRAFTATEFPLGCFVATDIIR